jgi:hypothetical protein
LIGVINLARYVTALLEMSQMKESFRFFEKSFHIFPILGKDIAEYDESVKG